MKVNALLPYYGAKRLQAPGIVAELGDHRAYWEPFCGSLAVLLAKPKCRQEVANDLNGSLVNLARVVQDDGLAPRLFDRLVRTAFSDAVRGDSAAWLACRDAQAGPDGADLDWAYHYFVSSWMGRNGLVGSDRERASGFCKRFTSNGGDPATRFRNAVESVPDWWERLRGVTILSDDALSLLDRVEDKQGTAVYCDPPYLVKGAKYLHDFGGDDHGRLAAALRRFGRTRVVVSYYRHPRLQELYVGHGFRLVDRGTTKQMGNGANAAPEVLLIKN